MMYQPEPVPMRLAKNVYEVDEGNSHIEVHQDVVEQTGSGDLLINCCPAHVYSRSKNGHIDAEFAACLECGTCLAIMPKGTLTWHYPESGMGVQFREG